MGEAVEQDWLTHSQERRALWALVGLGLVVRAFRYFTRFPLWEDECFLNWNYVGSSYADLLGPLHPRQVAPVLYLWTQLTVVKLLGFSELVLRLTTFVGGCAVLVLFPRFAGRFVRGVPLLIAVGLFAVSYPCTRYAAEAKQYGVELVVAFTLMAVTARWWERPERTRPLWVLAALAPIAVGLSYTAAFIGGGVSVAVAFVLWRERARRGWLPWAVYNALLAGAFGLVVLLAAKNQATAQLSFMRDYWHEGFPPVTQPLALARWFITTHSGQMLGYPVGGGPGTGALATLCIVIALVGLARRGAWRLCLLAVVPLALHFVAAALHRYPYGVHAKFTVYLAPLFCLLFGAGAGALVERFARSAKAARATLVTSLVVLGCVGAGSVLRDTLRPQKAPSDARARGFARWFWFDVAHDGEVICLYRDLGLSFSTREGRELSWLYSYLCNAAIYSPRLRRGDPPDLTREKLHFVRYRVGSFEYDEAAFERWLAETQARYAFVGRVSYPMPRYDKRDRRLIVLDEIDVYTFTQR